MTDFATCEQCKSPVQKDQALVRTIMIAPPIYGYSHPDCTDPWAGEVRTTSSTGGEKGVKPARFDLLPVGPLTTVAKLYGKGAEKYEDHNWRRGYEWSKSYAALMRHATQFWGGEDVDPDTGLPHMASVVFHALALIEYTEHHPDFDDRHKRDNDNKEPVV